MFRRNAVLLEIVHLATSMDEASKLGRPGLLQPLTAKPDRIPTYSFMATGWAALNGHVDVLEWWRSSGFDLKLRGNEIDSASTNGHVAVENGHVVVLNWWKSSGLTLAYTTFAIDRASVKGHVHVLDWWKSSGLSITCSSAAVDGASGNGHVDVLKWWASSGLEF
ncbi:hypothetical protein BJ742DRAFT_909255 [Cladochytrium replicatum]|nr:hypothetical protein BJ742DRAFT_909255 [Cladochytrium replicatum]